MLMLVLMVLLLLVLLLLFQTHAAARFGAERSVELAVAGAAAVERDHVDLDAHFWSAMRTMMRMMEFREST